MSKKWYNLFVSVDAPKEGAAQSGHAQPSPTAAEAIADIAARLGDPPKLSPSASNPSSFDEIYAAAEIPLPAHGFTVLKIAEMLQSEHIRSLPAGVKRSSILVALDASGVKIQEVIEDAVRRDRALDTYERVQQNAIDELEKKKNAENQQIQAEMDRLVAEHRARIRANSDDVTRAKEAFHSWRLQKQQEEQKIADAVSYFVTENPITSSSLPGAPPGKPAGQA